jgi:hypothetical protein
MLECGCTAEKVADKVMVARDYDNDLGKGKAAPGALAVV